jgi:hypothetical protein
MRIRVEETTHDHYITECALMKTFQKIALVSAIAAAPFAAQAELVSMDETSMGNTTGQAGVTIDMRIEGDGIEIGSVVYTDEGSLKINDIAITGTNAAGDANQVITLKQTVDVLANGDLQLVVTPDGGEQYLNIDVGSIDLVRQSTAGADAIAAATESSELINNLDMTVKLTGASTTTIHNVNIATQTLNDFGVSGTAGSSTAGLVISQGAAFQITDLNVGLFGYTEAQSQNAAFNAPYVATAKATYEAGFAQAVQADTDAGLGDNAIRDAFVTANGAADLDDNGTISAGGETTALTTGVAAQIASRSAVSITGLTLDNNGGAISMNQKIWANSKGVSIQIAAFDADLNIADIAIGGASIGSLAVNDISVAGLTQTIYGH